MALSNYDERQRLVNGSQRYFDGKAELEYMMRSPAFTILWTEDVSWAAEPYIMQADLKTIASHLFKRDDKGRWYAKRITPDRYVVNEYPSTAKFN